MNLSALNRTAAEVAAAAFTEMFPGIELLGGKRTSLGFSFDFLCCSPPPSEVEILLEERMRQIVREKRSIRVLEMVPFSARELLLKEGHAARAEEVSGEGLVEIVQIGGFHNLSSGPHLASTADLGAFKLWPMENAGAGLYRLSGCAFPSKEELKQFLKKLRGYPEVSHHREGLKKSLWRLLDGRVVWLPAGLKMQRELIELLRVHLFDGALEVSMGSGADRVSGHFRLAQDMGKGEVAEIYFEPRPSWDPERGLFAGGGGGAARVTYIVSDGNWEKKVISSLQRLGKTLNILGFQHLFRLSGRKQSDKGIRLLLRVLESQGERIEMVPEEPGGSRLECMVEDRLGRRWAAFSMELVAKGFFITASVERLVALLLEMKSRANAVK